MDILIIGSGGREHCLAWKIKQSELAGKIYIAPGNGGTMDLGENIDIKPDDIQGLAKFAEDKNIDLTVVGPEAPLVGGITDIFEEKGLKIFGPNKNLAQLEGSKIFAKQLLRKFNIPTADFEVFDNANKAKDYIRKKGAPLVIKADGLAAGKGVIVCNTAEQAIEGVEDIMENKKFGSAGEKIIIEDCLKGQEASIIAVCDGKNILPFLASQDHKQIFDDDKGPNTGGMGAYSPAPLVNEDLFQKIMNRIFYPLIQGLRQEDKEYKGVLYAGLMINDNNPYVLEFNVRFGDPETQAILPKLKNDFIDVMIKGIGGRLDKVDLDWDERKCVCVVLASGGYPQKYEKGKEIKGLDKVKGSTDTIIFHAGTKKSPSDAQNTKYLTSGGRVLNVVGLGESIQQAQRAAYSAIKKIKFDKMYYRKDIANKAVEQ